MKSEAGSKAETDKMSCSRHPYLDFNIVQCSIFVLAVLSFLILKQEKLNQSVSGFYPQN
jgi:hypothetical protein